MGCPRCGESCNKLSCGGNDYGTCVAGDDARVEDFMTAHDKEIRDKTVDEFIERLHKKYYHTVLDAPTFFAIEEVAKEMKGEVNV